LAAADAAATGVILIVAMWFREVLAPAWFGIDPFLPAASYASLWPVLLLVVGARAAFGLYPGHGVSDVAQLRGQTVATGLVAATVLAGGALFRFNEAYSRVVLVAWFVGVALALPLVRASVRWALARQPWFGVPVHVHASEREAGALAASLIARPGLGLRPVPHDAAASGAVVHLDDVDARLWDGLADRYARAWVVTHAWLAALPSSVTDIDGRVALELRARLLEPANRVVKRLLDLVLVVLSAPFVAVATVVVAIAIRLEGPGPVFLCHRRIGQAGRPVAVWKFRTMVPDASTRLREILDGDPSRAEEWAAYQKLHDDPRVTRVGRFLRTTSLDELPQAWNVLTGSMSWVGPRPILPEELERYGDHQALYLRVLPGITGLVQVSGRSDLSYERRVELDAYYVRNWSVWLDLVVLARTVAAVVSRRGAF
jgi:lipopolysaccharide/colanic/teichoic acid biosynthesis glycosyltransferase